MQPADLHNLNWRKSSYSASGPECVEIAHAPEAVAIRDSKDPNGPALLMPHAAFARFLNGLQ
jgi:hypothetical protein